MPCHAVHAETLTWLQLPEVLMTLKVSTEVTFQATDVSPTGIVTPVLVVDGFLKNVRLAAPHPPSWDSKSTLPGLPISVQQETIKHPSKINGFSNKVMATTQWRETKWKSQAQFQKTCQLPIYDSIIFYIWFESNESNPQAWRSQCCSGSLLRPKQLDWLNVLRKILLRPSAANTVVIEVANITEIPITVKLPWMCLSKSGKTRQTSPSARFLLLHHLVPLVLGARTVKHKVVDQNLSFFWW